MEVIILGLITCLIVISLIPTPEDKQRNAMEFAELLQCSPHKWIDKPTGLTDNSTYKVCGVCKFLPGGGYEV